MSDAGQNPADSSAPRLCAGKPAPPSIIPRVGRAGELGWFASHHTHRSGRTLVKALKLLMSAAVIGAVALAGQAYAQDKGLVGIAMPTRPLSCA